MYRKIAVLLILSILFILQPLQKELWATDFLRNIQVEHSIFFPLKGEKAQISFLLDREATVTLKIYNPDNYLVATPLEKKSCPAGTNTVFWNGLDLEHKVVADDVYYFTIQAIDNLGSSIEYNPLSFSGGEVVQVRMIGTEGGVGYELPEDALVRIRLGIHDGPMLKSLVDWEPRTAGKHFEKWNGKDDSNTISVDNENIAVDIQAFSLPENNLITTGTGIRSAEFIVGDSGDFATPQMRTAQLSQSTKQRLLIKKRSAVQQKNEHRQHPHASMNRATDRAPRFQIKVTTAGGINATKKLQEDNTSLSKENSLEDAGIITMTIDLEELTGIILANQRYEVLLYIDNVFYMEDEQGYHPYTFNLDTNTLSNGEHTLTFNVATLTGQVGSASTVINVNHD